MNVDKYGPWALVTGATDGIGRATATLLATKGFNVALVARRGDLLESLAAELALDQGIEAIALAADLSTAAGIDRVFAGTDQLEVGLLVAAAGFGTSGPFLANDVAAELNMIDLNCRAVAAMAHHYGGQMAARGRGGLILFGSIVGFQGVPGAANYAATKAFTQVLSEGLAVELGRQGVDVLSSSPGPVATGFGDRAGMDVSSGASSESVAKATLRALGRRRMVRPGARSKILGWALATAPRRLRTSILGQIMTGMAVHTDR